MLIYELMWLWKLIGIALAAAAAGALCVHMVFKLMKKRTGRAALICGGIAGLVIALIGIFIAARKAMPVGTSYDIWTKVCIYGMFKVVFETMTLCML